MNKSMLALTISAATLALSAFASAAGATPFKEPSRPAMNNDHAAASPQQAQNNTNHRVTPFVEPIRPAMNNDHSAQAASPSQTTRAQAKSHTKTPRITPFSQRARPPMEAQARSKPRSATKSTDITPADMHPGRLKRTEYQ